MAGRELSPDSIGILSVGNTNAWCFLNIGKSKPVHTRQPTNPIEANVVVSSNAVGDIEEECAELPVPALNWS